MQKIHILYENESMEKIANLYNIQKENLKMGNGKIDNNDYVIVEDGKYDIMVILNNTHEVVYRLKDDNEFNLINKNNKVIDFTGKDQGSIVLFKQCNNIVHIVQPKENIQQISEIYQVKTRDIIKKNNLKTAHLFIGQKLDI